jgi:Flp pilus assembly protein TadG
MHNLLRCRRGTAAFVTVVALVPLIGFVALGGEAGSWYVTKQHAQNAADSAALSGALAIANSNSQPNFGNGFSLKNVVVTQGTYSTGSGFQSLNPGETPAAVQAQVTQCQPQALSLVLFSTNCTDANGSHEKNVTITAQAVALVTKPQFLPCTLALTGPVTFQDAAVQVDAPNCAIASNGKPIGIDFKVAPKQLTVGSLSTAGGCSGSLCGSVTTYAPPVIDPFSALLTAISGLTLPKCSGSTLQPYATGQCANDNQTINSATLLNVSGVYIFSGGLTLGGTGSLATAPGVSATIIVLPVANNKTSLKMAGGSSFNITAPTTAPSTSAIPSQLASVAKLIVDMAIFDPEQSPQITGGATMKGSGVFYLPNADPLNYQGDSTSTGSKCTEVIAASINFSGTPNFDNSGCTDDIRLKSQVVVLVK